MEEKRDITSSPPLHDSQNAVSSTTPSATLDGSVGNNGHSTSKSSKEQVSQGPPGPRVRVEDAESRTTPPNGRDTANGSSLMPSTTDEAATQVSSSSGSGKPASLDGKSIMSGATFALDEKESLRPDDSASLKGGEDDEVFSPPSAGLPSSRVGSDDGYKAFREQLQEITTMNPAPRSDAPASRPTVVEGSSKGVLYVPPPGSGVGVVPAARPNSSRADGNASQGPDQKLLEALESPRDRIWVLKLEQDIIDFVKDPKESSLNLPQCNSFYRMLAHKIADYYLLGHLVDDVQSAVRLFKTPQCRIPPPLTGIATPSTAASTPPPQGPQVKILRRGVGEGPPSLGTSKATSENGDSGNEDDKQKAPMSREEREARYEAARERIMGSAKPTDTTETAKEMESRSSSAQAKKPKKKQRSDSEDGFEARSAYNAFYAPPVPGGPPGNNPPVFGNFSTASSGQQSPVVYGQHAFAGQVPQYGAPSLANANWGNQAYPAMDQSQSWAQGQQQQSPYELANDFQRMSVQQQGNMAQGQGMTPQYNTGYMQQQPYAQQPTWPQQQQQQLPHQPQQQSQQQQWPQYGSQMAFNSGQQYPGFNTTSPYNRPASSSSQSSQPYAYGQLPSQTFPGRLPSNLEHPIPGSFKSQHFNPQSQTFVPNGNSSASPFTPQRMTPSGSGYAAPYTTTSPQIQRQHQQAQQQSQPYSSLPATPSSRTLTHPLPAAVFPRQPSPNIPLPPKPQASFSQQQQTASASPVIASSTSHQSNHQINNGTSSKWTAPPPSLPAKPPPPATATADSLDAARFHQGVGGGSGGNMGMSMGLGPRQSGYGSGGLGGQGMGR